MKENFIISKNEIVFVNKFFFVTYGAQLLSVIFYIPFRNKIAFNYLYDTELLLK